MNIIFILISPPTANKLNRYTLLFCKCYYLCKTNQYFGWVIITKYINNKNGKKSRNIWTLLDFIIYSKCKKFNRLTTRKSQWFIISLKYFWCKGWCWLVGDVDWSLISLYKWLRIPSQSTPGHHEHRLCLSSSSQ